MEQITIARYHIFSKPGEWIHMYKYEKIGDIERYYIETYIRKIGNATIINPGYANVFVYENTFGLYEIKTNRLLTYSIGTIKPIRLSQQMRHCGLILNTPINGYTPKTNVSSICYKCLNSICINPGICNRCNTQRSPWIPINDCIVDYDLISQLMPECWESISALSQLPFKEELIAAAFHPMRPNMLKNTQDIHTLRSYLFNYSNDLNSGLA
jgi:hypothetical protein